MDDFIVMTKKELFIYMNSGIDKSGNLKKEGGFKKHYPQIYDEYIHTTFPQEIDELPFKQKLWHFLNDIYDIPVCKICGNPVNFLTKQNHWGYCVYCSGACAMHDNEIKEKVDNTKLNKYGSRTYNNSEKQKETVKSKGDEYWIQHHKKSLKTRFEKNDGKYFSDDTIQKIKNTNIQKYGVDCYAKTKDFLKIVREKHKEIQEKQYITKKQNNSFNSSLIEKQFDEFLKSLSIEYIHQYKSSLYPFTCDFYIIDIDLYIEIQGSWTHGNHPFDENNKDDIDKLNVWKNKSGDYYKQAIYTWTNLDVKKRNIAKENELNYLEIFSDDLNESKSILYDYIIHMISNFCITQKFPGTFKWPSNHPIWSCNVGNRMSPISAWSNKSYIEKAAKNIISLFDYDIKFRDKHINEFMKCEIRNNQIISSTYMFLKLILDRFTIAKIAPKVTALSANTMKNIIYESNIDISNGVYIPMAGFGGIVEGAKMWGQEHNKTIECECYDINPEFCKWYGWTQRDMLYQKIKTDKVCICCPPFGKEYEHWNGTPKDMSNKTFKEWYHLIKEYVDAPSYIIIGPEISSKSSCGLFAKKVGVMVWTDDMIEKYSKK